MCMLTSTSYIAAPYKAKASLIQQLENHMLEHKAYQIKGLSVEQLAQRLQIPAQTLLLLINQYCGQNFIDWLNTYRIKYVMVMFHTSGPAKFTINKLALQAGFTSSSSFYAAFKALHGCTPGQYLKKLTVFN
jgi:AraC-like DNA-binding protein